MTQPEVAVMTLPWWGTACGRRAALARGAGLGLGLAWLVALHPGHADEGGEIPEPITITLPKAKLQPVAALQNAKIDHIDFLPDGRIAVIVATSRATGGSSAGANVRSPYCHCDNKPWKVESTSYLYQPSGGVLLGRNSSMRLIQPLRKCR
jgi:hypothetical protein